jgi:hypothetical protein
MRFISMRFRVKKSKVMVCVAALAVLPMLATCSFVDSWFASKGKAEEAASKPDELASRQEPSPYWLRDLNHNGVIVARTHDVSPGLRSARPTAAYSAEALFAEPVAPGPFLADAGARRGIVPISALRPDADPASALAPPPEEAAPPPAVISANYQSPDLAQSAAMVTDRLGPTFSDHPEARVVVSLPTKPQPGAKLRLGLRPVHRVQKSPPAFRRTPVTPVIATPLGRGAVAVRTPTAVAASPETPPPAPRVPLTPVVAAALVGDTTPTGPAAAADETKHSDDTDTADTRTKTRDGAFRLQLASLRDRGSATSEGARLKSNYGDILGDKSLVLESADLGSRGVFHRVQLGPFGSRDNASLACSDLKARGQDCLVVVR